jgi:hypothetical protein
MRYLPSSLSQPGHEMLSGGDPGWLVLGPRLLDPGASARNGLGHADRARELLGQARESAAARGLLLGGTSGKRRVIETVLNPTDIRTHADSALSFRHSQWRAGSPSSLNMHWRSPVLTGRHPIQLFANSIRRCA